LFAVEIVERSLALLQCLERILAILGREPVEVLAVEFACPGIGGDDAGGEKLPRRERQLIAILPLGLPERPIAVHFGAAAPRAGELTVDESHDPAIGAGRREFVGRDHRVGRGGEERDLCLGEREISRRSARRRRSGGGGACGRLRRRGGGRGKTRGNGGAGAQQEIATSDRTTLVHGGFFGHGNLPCFAAPSLKPGAGTRRTRGGHHAAKHRLVLNESSPIFRRAGEAVEAISACAAFEVSAVDARNG
jgi:hypothetical protein